MKHTIILTLVAGLGLAACQSPMQALNESEPIGSPFQTALMEEYKTLSNQQATAYDWKDANHFARKGLLAAKGYDVPPEFPEEWHVSSTMLERLSISRKALEQLFTDRLIVDNPEQAAHAQSRYDCWVEATEEAPASEQAKACEESFQQALSKLEALYNQGISKRKKYFKKTKQKYIDVDTISAKPHKLVPTSIDKTINGRIYSVYFKHGTGIPSRKIKEQVKAIVADMKKKNTTDNAIILNGYADSTGPEDFNRFISEKRVKAIRDLLVKENIASNNITLFAFGESQDNIDGQDNVSNPEDRRVDIVIGQ